MTVNDNGLTTGPILLQHKLRGSSIYAGEQYRVRQLLKGREVQVKGLGVSRKDDLWTCPCHLHPLVQVLLIVEVPRLVDTYST